MRLRRVWIPPLVAFACSTTLLASSARAQVQNAAMSGLVRDPTGAPLPDVQVETSSSTLVERRRTAVTDRQGVFKITELPPGTYTVTFVHREFATLKYERIELPGSFMATVNVHMRPGRVEEVISLDASAPRIDTQTVTTPFQDRFAFEIQLGGKHSKGSMICWDRETKKTWLLKSGSGGAGGAGA